MTAMALAAARVCSPPIATCPAASASITFRAVGISSCIDGAETLRPACTAARTISSVAHLLLERPFVEAEQRCLVGHRRLSERPAASVRERQHLLGGSEERASALGEGR